MRCRQRVLLTAITVDAMVALASVADGAGSIAVVVTVCLDFR